MPDAGAAGRGDRAPAGWVTRERALLARIDGIRTLEELFDGSGLGSTDALRIAARLIRIGRRPHHLSGTLCTFRRLECDSSDAMKIVLAYSGGLDTSVAIVWLKEKYDAEIVGFCSDVGQGEDLEAARKKALRTGAVSCHVLDQRDEFVRDFVFPAVRAASGLRRGRTTWARRWPARASRAG